MDKYLRAAGQDIPRGPAFARNADAAVHKAAKDAAQTPALLYGPLRNPLSRCALGFIRTGVCPSGKSAEIERYKKRRRNFIDE